jgi:hypothetical protein
VRLFEGQELYGFYVMSKRDWWNQVFNGVFYLHRRYVDLTVAEVRCLELASKAIDRYDLAVLTQRRHGGGYHLNGALADPIHIQARNWPSSAHTSNYRFVVWAAMFASLIYGGLHLLAWSASFPTRAEVLLWRISGLTIAGSGLLFPIRYFVGLVSDSSIQEPWHILTFLSVPQKYRVMIDDIKNKIPLDIRDAGSLVGWAIFVAFISLYLLSRTYLVVECFINIPHLPPSVYKVPNWSQYMPHIT